MLHTHADENTDTAQTEGISRTTFVNVLTQLINMMHAKNRDGAVERYKAQHRARALTHTRCPHRAGFGGPEVARATMIAHLDRTRKTHVTKATVEAALTNIAQVGPMTMGWCNELVATGNVGFISYMQLSKAQQTAWKKAHPPATRPKY